MKRNENEQKWKLEKQRNKYIKWWERLKKENYGKKNMLRIKILIIERSTFDQTDNTEEKKIVIENMKIK